MLSSERIHDTGGTATDSSLHFHKCRVQRITFTAIAKTVANILLDSYSCALMRRKEEEMCAQTVLLN